MKRCVLSCADKFSSTRNHLPKPRSPSTHTLRHLQASHCAVLGGHLETVVSLSKVDPGFPTLLYTRNNKGETPGYAAARAGHHEMLEALHAASPLILAERDNAGVCAMRGKGVERPTRDVIRALEGTVPRYLQAWHANISYLHARMPIRHACIPALDTCPQTHTFTGAPIFFQDPFRHKITKISTCAKNAMHGICKGVPPGSNSADNLTLLPARCCDHGGVLRLKNATHGIFQVSRDSW